MPRQSIEIDSFAHVNPIPAASRVGPLVVSSIIPPFNAGERKVPEDIQDCIRNIFLHMGNMLEAARYTALAPDGPKVSAEFIAYVE